MFRRVSLVGSAELFKETGQAPELPPEPEPPFGREPEPARLHPLPSLEPGVRQYVYQLSQGQVRVLIDALQRLKYPHTGKGASKPSMEEFEQLEALRQVLLEGLK